MAYQLILSTDTLDQGRVKINDFFINSSNLFSAGTGTNSTIRLNSYNKALGPYNFIVGQNNSGGTGAYNSILGGQKNFIGNNNFMAIVSGYNNQITSSGAYSIILGGKNNLSTFGGVVLGGQNNVAYTSCVVLGGNNNQSGGDYGSKNIVGGFSNRTYGSVSGPYSAVYSGILWGKNNRVLRDYSFIGGGLNNINTGRKSVIGGGKNNTINNVLYSSIVGGRGNRVAHSHSIAFGGGAQTSGAFSIVLGNQNTDTPSTGNVVFRVSSNGQIYSDASTSIIQPADYAEYFEWNDGNPDNEDRKGLFVSLVGEKITIGNSDVIGIVSATPAFVGDTADMFWKDLKLKNEWGQYIFEIYSGFTVKNKEEIVYINQKNEIFKEIPSAGHIKGIKKEDINFEDINFNNFIDIYKSHVYNDNFNSELEYIPRSERKEWSPIGLLGKLLVKTSEKITSNKVDAGLDGKAKNGTKYHVLKTIKEFDGNYGIVQVLFK